MGWPTLFRAAPHSAGKTATVALFFAAMSVPSVSNGQPEPPRYFAETGHWYQVVRMASQPLCWQACRDSAVAMGGYLATIHSESENAFIVDSLLPPTEAPTFLGGFQPVNYGPWVWVSGEPFSFSNWASGEPNEGAANEDYIEMWTEPPLRGTWNDIGSCGRPDASFVLEYDMPCLCGLAAIRPCPFAASDVNCDGITDIRDVVEAVNSAFRGVEPPPPCCDYDWQP